MHAKTTIRSFAVALPTLRCSCNLDVLFGWFAGEFEKVSPLVDVRDFYVKHFHDSICSRRDYVTQLMQPVLCNAFVQGLTPVQFFMFLACRLPALSVNLFCLFDVTLLTYFLFK
jgi:hypothetical protein